MKLFLYLMLLTSLNNALASSQETRENKFIENIRSRIRCQENTPQNLFCSALATNSLLQDIDFGYLTVGEANWINSWEHHNYLNTLDTIAKVNTIIQQTENLPIRYQQTVLETQSTNLCSTIPFSEFDSFVLDISEHDYIVSWICKNGLQKWDNIYTKCQNELNFSHISEESLLEWLPRIDTISIQGCYSSFTQQLLSIMNSIATGEETDSEYSDSDNESISWHTLNSKGNSNRETFEPAPKPTPSFWQRLKAALLCREIDVITS